MRVIGTHVRDLVLPTLTLRRSALEHNTDLFARWCADNAVDHAPPGKTTMAPQLFQWQLAAGAWAITAATVTQTQVMWRHGLRRALLATQVIDPAGLAWIAGPCPPTRSSSCSRWSTPSRAYSGWTASSETAPSTAASPCCSR